MNTARHQDDQQLLRQMLSMDLADWHAAQRLLRSKAIRLNGSHYNVVLAGERALRGAVQVHLSRLGGMSGAW